MLNTHTYIACGKSSWSYKVAKNFGDPFEKTKCDV